MLEEVPTAGRTLDIAIVYTPQVRSGITVERLFEEALILVSSGRGRVRSSRAPYLDVVAPGHEVNASIPVEVSRGENAGRREDWR